MDKPTILNPETHPELFHPEARNVASHQEETGIVERAPRFQDWLKWYSKSDTVLDAQAKMMAPFVTGPMVARTVHKKVSISFKGSMAKFQAAAEMGIPVAVKLGQVLSYKQFLPRQRKPQKTMGAKEQMLCTQLTPDKYDVTKGIVHSVTIVKYDNGAKAHLGLHCNAVPEAYMNMGGEEIKRLLKFFNDNEGDVWCNKHIPALSSGEHRIPVIREVANGYNSRHIACTFGGIYTPAQLNNGTIILTPELCQQIGLEPPKTKYIVPGGIDTRGMSDEEFASKFKLNTWVIVSAGHAHTWVCSLPPQAIRQLGYEIYPVRVDGERVPFYLMDYVTVDKLTYFVGTNILPKIDRRDLRDITVTLQPFVPSTSKTGGWTGPSWLDYDMDPNEPFEVNMDLIVSYTLFPIGMANNANVACIMTDNFPPMRLDGSLSTLLAPNGNEESDQKKGKNE